MFIYQIRERARDIDSERDNSGNCLINHLKVRIIKILPEILLREKDMQREIEKERERY